MADRNLDFDPTVTNVTPKMPDTGLLSGATDLADQVAVMSANSKALNAVAQTSMAYRQADEQFRQQAAGNPDDPQAMQDLQAKRAQITTTIGSQVPAIASREYMSHVIELGQNSDKINTIWAMHQDTRNAVSDMQTAQDTYTKKAAMDGRQFGLSGGDMGQLSSILTFDDAKNAITKFATPILGAPKTEDALKDFSSNYVRAFVSGVAENNPAAAKLMLQQPNITEHFTAQEINDMGALVKKTEKQQQFIQNINTAKNDGSLIDVVNSPDGGYLEKINQIQKLAAAGDVSPKAATAAVKILHSQAAVDAQTDKPTMDAILTQTAELNANAVNDSGEYLQGVKDIHERILTETYKGNLTQEDADRLAKDVNAKTAGKLAKASNDAGMSFAPAVMQKFDTLPPEYRAQATVQLFNDSYKQNWTQQQQSNRATTIIQQIQDQRRQAAIKTVNGIRMSDDDVVKAAGYKMGDVNQTAKESGLTPQQVISLLRTHSGAAKRAEANKVTSIKGGGSVDERDDEEGGPVNITRTGNTESDNEAMDSEIMQ